MRRLRWKWILVVCIGLGLAESLTLLAPPPAESDEYNLCVKTHHFNAKIRTIENCDSRHFLELARNPSLILTTEQNWQTRPGYAVLGSVFAAPLLAIDYLVRKAIATDIPWNPYYIGFVMLNFCLLVASVLIFLRLAGSKSIHVAAVAIPVTALAVNEVTKAFFWTPHLQIFGLLVPLLVIGLPIWSKREFATTRLSTLAVMGTTMGIACVTYGSFLLLPAVLCLEVGRRVAQGEQGTRRNLLLRLGIVIALCFAVIEAWRAFVIWKTGDFVSMEVRRYHEFIWVREDAALGLGYLTDSLIIHLFVFCKTIVPVLAPPMVLVAVAWIVARVMGIEPDDIVPRELALAIGMFFVLAVPFLYFLGFYKSRLDWILVPPLLLIAARTLMSISARVPQKARLSAAISAYAAAAGYVAFWMLKSGPYS